MSRNARQYSLRDVYDDEGDDNDDDVDDDDDARHFVLQCLALQDEWDQMLMKVRNPTYGSGNVALCEEHDVYALILGKKVRNLSESTN